MSRSVRRWMRSPRLHAVRGFVLTALFLIGQIATFVHSATTEHRVCSEHGELIDVAAMQHGTSPSSMRSETPELHGGAPTSSDSHEHCQLGTPLKERTGLLVDQAHSSVGPRIAIAPRTEPSVERHDSVPLLLLAPKQSPPT